MTLFLSALLNGLAVGAIYGLVGVGLTVIYNTTRVFNLAQGDLVVVAIMTSYWLLDLHRLAEGTALVLVIVITVLVALFEERVIVRPFFVGDRVGTLGWFIATLGFGSVIEGVLIIRLGSGVQAIPSPISLGAVHIGQLILAYRQLFTVAVFLVSMAVLGYFFTRTWLGRAMRAVAQDREAADLRGINPLTMSKTAFLVAGVAAGIAGFVVAPAFGSDPTVGLELTLKGFLALAIGGFGSVRGAVAGGLLLGVAEQLFDFYVNSNLEILVGVVVVLIVLTIRPQGLFRAPTQRSV
jgi:branched-chain amino acid transport system permease protein